MRFNEVKVLNGDMALAGPRAACAKADVLSTFFRLLFRQTRGPLVFTQQDI
jgi:hypothetical protein